MFHFSILLLTAFFPFSYTAGMLAPDLSFKLELAKVISLTSSKSSLVIINSISLKKFKRYFKNYNILNLY